MGKLFISYRRSQGHFVDRLAKAMQERVDGTVFVDLTGIMEDDFEHALMEGIRTCDAFILVVSPDTFAQERISDEDDWIRREIALALETKSPTDPNSPLPIVLVLEDGFKPPKAVTLPKSIRGIATKQGIEFHRPFFDESVERLIEHCTRVTHGRLVRKAQATVVANEHLDIRLKQSVREAVEQLTRDLVRGLDVPPDSGVPGVVAHNAWSAAEGLLALLYTESSSLGARTAAHVDLELITRLATKLTRIDSHVADGGIPAFPDFQVADRGVVDSTAKVVSALCSLRLYLYQHSLDHLGTYEPVTLADVDTCIARLCDWLRRNQNPDGGWGLWRGTKSRVTATAFAVIALLDAGEDSEEAFMQEALGWLQDTQREDGWWGLTPESDRGDVTSTAFAVAALSMLCSSITHESIQRAIHTLERNTDWDDAIHTVTVEAGDPPKTISMTYAAEPRAVYALLLAGASPTSPTILAALQRLIDSELPNGGWTSKSARVRKMDVWYTYVVVESIYAWFTHCKQARYLIRLSRTEQALSGLLVSHRQVQEEVARLTKRLGEIKQIATL